MGQASRLKILVVDDNEACAQTLGWMVELFGHEVRMAFDGTTAIDIARTYKPDIVLMDIGLPVMNGYETCKRMRHELPSDTIFIAQTGWSEREHRQRSREAGFDYHLVKPIPMQELETLVAAISRKAPLHIAV